MTLSTLEKMESHFNCASKLWITCKLFFFLHAVSVSMAKWGLWRRRWFKVTRGMQNQQYGGCFLYYFASTLLQACPRVGLKKINKQWLHATGSHMVRHSLCLVVETETENALEKKITNDIAGINEFHVVTYVHCSAHHSKKKIIHPRIWYLYFFNVFSSLAL